ncbi:MAG: hypothetical protein V5A46_04180 [Haloferacaceae archaeon]
MRSYPETPAIENADDALFEGGHLWIREWIDGAPLRFRLTSSGAVRFGDGVRTFDPNSIPGAYRHATRHVRDRLDRDALADAVDDVGKITFFGVATQRLTVEYDWDRLPSVLGTEVWSDEGGFLPPDAANRAYERLGLEPVNAFRKEVPPRDFEPSRDAIPNSEWYDGPAAGIEIRNTRGHRGKLLNPDLRIGSPPTPEPVSASAPEAARQLAPEDRVRHVANRLRERGITPTVDTLYEYLLDDVLRRHHRRLNHPSSTVDRRALRSELASIVGESLGGMDRRVGGGDANDGGDRSGD